MTRRVATVFGGSGFIGRHLVQRLAADDWIVRVGVRDPVRARFLQPLGDAGQIVPLAADVADPAAVAPLVAGATAVFNLVGILYESGRKRTFQRIHAEGARVVAEAAAQAGVGRLVQVSAIGADRYSPSVYARTKAAGEAAARAAFPDVTILRPSVVFGPEDGFFNLFAGLARFMPVLPVIGAPMLPTRAPKGGPSFLGLDFFGAGGPKMQPVYVGDVAAAAIAVLARPDTKGKLYELGGPRVYSFKELMELVLRETGRRRLLVPLPYCVAATEAWFLEKLPKPMLTTDQVAQLRRDNVVGAGALGLADLGIEPAAAEAIVPTYLRPYRPPASQGARR